MGTSKHIHEICLPQKKLGDNVPYSFGARRLNVPAFMRVAKCVVRRVLDGLQLITKTRKARGILKQSIITQS